MNSTVKRLTTSAMLVALATLLSLITFYKLPYGGSITAFSMLPICVIAYKYGFKWGILGGFTHGMIQMIISGSGGAFAAMSITDFILMLILDYLLAYSCLGLTAVTRGKFKNERNGFMVGIVIAASARLLAHFASGLILFSSYAEWFFSQDGFKFGAWVLEHMSGNGLFAFYSFFYNASFLVPETVITVIMGAVIIQVLKGYILDEIRDTK